MLAVFDRYPVPAALGSDEWRELRAELARRLADRHCIRRSAPWISRSNGRRAYFDLMPIHEKLRGRDFPTTRNYLRVTLCNIHDEFSRAGWTCRALAASSRTQELA